VPLTEAVIPHRVL